MKTTADFLDDLRARCTLPSDSKLALNMKWERQQLSRYRMGKSTFDDQTALKVAAALGIEPDYIMACMSAQRARTPETRSAWERIAAKVAAAVLICNTFVAGTYSSPASARFDINTSAGQFAPAGSNLYICDKRRRRQERTPGRWKQAAQALSRWLRTLGLTLALAACASGGPWSGADIGREAAYQALLTADCAQTRWGASHPAEHEEGNHLLPRHPSKATINGVCLGTGLGHYAISRWSSGDGRTAWQGVTIGIELGAVDTNRMAGVKIEF